MNGLLDEVVNIFIGIGAICTGVMLASWIYYYLVKFISDKVWNSPNASMVLSFLLVPVLTISFLFLAVAISYGVFQLVDDFVKELQIFG